MNQNKPSRLKKLAGFVLAALAILLLLAAVVPFLIPVPPLAGLRPPQELADAESRFAEINGFSIHHKVAGLENDAAPPLVLLHGFASSLFTWREVMPALAQTHPALAFDRPAFGLSGRPLSWSGANPYTPEAQLAFILALLEQYKLERPVLVGNSAGGTIATLFALTYPERVRALVLVDAAIYAGGGAPDAVKPLLRTPQMRRLGPLVSRSLLGNAQDLINLAWHDPGKVTPEILAGYQQGTQVENWDKALWEFTLASRDLKLSQRLNELTLPVLVISGDDDRIVPTEQSIRLADELPNAQLALIPNCGHLPQEECPQAVLAAIEAFLAGLPLE